MHSKKRRRNEVNMKEENTLLVGYDLDNEYTQINCCTSSSEPETVFASGGMEQSMIPTALCCKEETGEWFYGSEALECRNQKNGIYVDDLLGKLIRGENQTIFDIVYRPEQLLEKFLRRTLGLLRTRYADQGILQMVLTVRGLSHELSEKLKLVLEGLGLLEDRVQILDYGECFMHYALSQKKELWQNDVVLFDYGKKGLVHYQLTIGKRTVPAAVMLHREDLSNEFPYALLQRESPERLSFHFMDVAEVLLHRQLVSTLYFTGTGFEGAWAVDTMKKLCFNRRVFRGQNLYTKGACYAAKAIYTGGRKDILLLSEERLYSSFSLKVYHNTKEEEIILGRAGEEWKYAGNKLRVILDDTACLEFTINNTMKKMPITVDMVLEGLTKRENKTIQLEIEVSFPDRNTAIVFVRDLGFGGFYETNYRVWEQTFVL